MVRLLRQFARLFGAVGVVLAVMFALAPALPAQACAPGEPDAAWTAVIDAGAAADDCGSDGCADCGLGCQHGCCHAPHPVLSPNDAARTWAPELIRPARWGQALAPPVSTTDGPERPPRP